RKTVGQKGEAGILNRKLNATLLSQLYDVLTSVLVLRLHLLDRIRPQAIEDDRLAPATTSNGGQCVVNLGRKTVEDILIENSEILQGARRPRLVERLLDDLRNVSRARRNLDAGRPNCIVVDDQVDRVTIDAAGDAVGQKILKPNARMK